MFKNYWRDYKNLVRAEQEFHKKHWLSELVLTVGGFAVCGASLALIGGIDNVKKKKEQTIEESDEEPIEEEVV